MKGSRQLVQNLLPDAWNVSTEARAPPRRPRSSKKLGVEEARVSEALQAFREANRPSTPPADGERPDAAARDAALATSLAETLGIEESKVAAALEELRSERQAEKAAALKTRLDQAVTDGKLTQADAAAVTKALENGVIGGGR